MHVLPFKFSCGVSKVQCIVIETQHTDYSIRKWTFSDCTWVSRISECHIYTFTGDALAGLYWKM